MDGSTSRALRDHAPFFILWSVAAVLFLSFTSGDSIATLADDSVSYLSLARSYSGSAGGALLPWVKFQAHFPPLFPLALAASGGADNLRIAHAVVAAFAVLGLAMAYIYGMLRFGRGAPVLAVVILFLMSPSAWISLKGILSESLYLFLSLAALCFYERWTAAPAQPRPALSIVLGVLFAAAWLTRMAGIALPAAYLVYAIVRAARDRNAARWRLALPLVVFVGLAATWLALRPPGDTGVYQAYVTGIAESWKNHPLLMLQVSAKTLWYAWIQTFMTDAEISVLPRIVLALLAIVTLAGTVRRALKNHLDGWYVLAALGMVSFYVLPDNDERRILYPILPLLLTNAAALVLDIADGLQEVRQRNLVLAGVALMLVGVCAPAMVVVAVRARDTAPLVPGGHVSASDILEYYTTLNTARARAIAAREAAVIEGLGRLKAATPPEAKVMWLRPEYVAVLGDRQGAPFYFHWDARQFAEAIQASGTTHAVLASVFKSDLLTVRADPVPVTRTAAEYSDVVMTVKNAVTGRDEFILFKVDPARLSAYLAH